MTIWRGVDSGQIFGSLWGVAGATQRPDSMCEYDPLQASTAALDYEERRTYKNAEHVALRILSLHARCGVPSSTPGPGDVVVDTSLRISTVGGGLEELIALSDVLRAALWSKSVSAIDRSIWGMVRFEGYAMRDVPGHPKGRVESVLERLDYLVDTELVIRGMYGGSDG